MPASSHNKGAGGGWARDRGGVGVVVGGLVGRRVLDGMGVGVEEGVLVFEYRDSRVALASATASEGPMGGAQAELIANTSDKITGTSVARQLVMAVSHTRSYACLTASS